MKIVVLDGYTENPGDLSWEGLQELGELTVYDRTPVGDTAEIIRRIGDAQAVFTNKKKLKKEVFEAYQIGLQQLFRSTWCITDHMHTTNTYALLF